MTFKLKNGLLLLLLGLLVQPVLAQRTMERLGRGLVAVRTSASQVYIGWRMLGTEPENIGFHLYRGATRLTRTPLTQTTNFVDETSENGTYTVRPVLNGVEQAVSAPAPVQSLPYRAVPLQLPPGGETGSGTSVSAYTYTAGDASAGDLDGDGEYEIVLKWDPTNAKDNSQRGFTGNVLLDAYKLDGTRLWRIDLGRNIRAGAHYTQFIVYDLDSDGKAEVACRTADGTVDGQGKVLGDGAADHRNESGYILKGPEFVTIFNGSSGAAMASARFLPQRDPVAGDNPTPEQLKQTWGDNYGNRIDRFLACVAYLDGETPSLVMTRGYYIRAVLTAWDWKAGKLTHRWTFDSDDSTPGNAAYRGQGNHNLSVNDLDGDGRDEIVFGSCAIDDNGKGLYATGRGHGDALHLSDLDPDRPGLELFSVHEEPESYGSYPLDFRDARTGRIIWGAPGPNMDDVGRGIAADIDPRYRGAEAWGSVGGLYSAKGELIPGSKPSQMNFAIWWDADLTRELLDRTTISKWNWTTGRAETLLSPEGVSSNNGTKATPALSADLLGDWREEVVWRASDNRSLRIYTTTIPARNRLPTLMHDPQYRLSIAWQNVAYNQPPHTGFYLGADMPTPTRPKIVLAGNELPPVVTGERKAANRPVAYPNPVNQQELTVEMPTLPGQRLTLNLVSLQGKTLLTRHEMGVGGRQLVQLPLGGLSAGRYLLKIQAGGERTELPILKH
ncbi:rhamnogalacturonan lyase family protein [Tellurirhabdus rosea]|uniref:rhamnogalacturonan lyase family protein n=1 Tax=Tellurirhabdus rosea TaxID=2674997 RepID=UPI002259E87A|nr:T9SS type A sorting domain-containing protein [Tellurirhabdus rosea]